MRDLPKKKVTFFFTDMESSTRLAQELGEQYPVILATHQDIIARAVENHGGKILDTAGDGHFIVFDFPGQALLAAVEIQKAFSTESWALEVGLKVRIGIHTGEAIVAPRGFIGIEVHKSSRICQAAHGGQTVLSQPTLDQVRKEIKSGLKIKKLGSHLLKGFEAAEMLYQLSYGSGQTEFPPLRIEPRQPIVAVLPFRDIKHTQGQEYFGDGIAEEIIIALGRIPGLQVVARSLSFSMKGKGLDAQKAGKQLNATAVLEGSIRIVEPNIRLMVELVDTKTGFSLWGEIYDRELSEVFELQDEIAGEVAEALHVTGKTRSVRRVKNMHSSILEAYDFYIRGRQFYYKFSKAAVTSALNMFNQAILLDKKYALAHSGRADCLAYLYTYDDSNPYNLEMADQSSKVAIELDPLLAEAHTSRGFVLSLKHHFEAAIASFERAIELDPKLFNAYYLYGRACFAEGELEKAGALFEKANVYRPEDFQSLLLAGQVYGDLGQVDKSIRAYQRALKLIERHLKFNPEDARALYMAANAYAILGKRKKSLAALTNAVVYSPEDPMVLYNAGCIYSLLDMPNEALNYLEKAIDAGLRHKGWFENDSNLDGLRQMKRFQGLLEQISQVQHQV